MKSNSVKCTNNFLYNGKEQQNFTGYYAYGFRQFDSQIARWHSIDKLAESLPNVSPYAYVAGNPVSMVDVLGLLPVHGYDQVVYNPFKPGGDSGQGIWWGVGEDNYNDMYALTSGYYSAIASGFAGSFGDYKDGINGAGFTTIDGHIVSNSSIAWTVTGAAAQEMFSNMFPDERPRGGDSGDNRNQGETKGAKQSKQDPPVDLQTGNIVTKLIQHFHDIYKNKGVNPKTNNNYHVSELVDANSIPNQDLFTKLFFGSMTNNSVSGTSYFGENRVDWYIVDRSFMDNYNSNYINDIIDYKGGANGVQSYQIRAVYQNETKISIIYYNYNLFKRHWNKVIGNF